MERNDLTPNAAKDQGSFPETDVNSVPMGFPPLEAGLRVELKSSSRVRDT